MTFHKSDLISHVAAETAVSKAQAQKAVDSVFSGIIKALQSGKKAKFVGFGMFSVQKRKARQGINLKTQERMEIPASKTVSFKSGKTLKDGVNS